MLFHVIAMVAFPLIYSAYVGVAEGARARALALAAKRPVDDGLLTLVGEMENRFAAAELAFERLIEIAECGAPGPATTSRAMTARTLAGQAAIATVEKAMEAAGGAAFYRRHGLERAFRDVQAARFHPLQEKPQQRLAARIALGLDIDG
jgi:acyl-CoA dehydrogenase